MLPGPGRAPSLAFGGEKPFRIDGRRAAGARGRDGLPIDMIRTIAGHKDAGDVGHRALPGKDEAVFVQVDFALEQIRVRHMADGDEHAGHRQQTFRPGLQVLQFHRRHLVLLHVENLRDGGIPDRLDLRIGQRALGHDLGRAQGVAPVDQIHDGAEPREVLRLLARRIPAAHHDERLVAKGRQRPVARRAVSHALGFQFMFAGRVQMLVARAGGDDDRLRQDRVAVHDELERPLGKIHGIHDAEARLRAETLRLLLHPRHQFVAVHALGEAGEILHDAGGGEQAAGLLAREDERRELGAGGIERGRPAGGTGTDDDNFFHSGRKVNAPHRADKAVEN